MNHDIDVKKVRINCYRQSKVAGEFMLQLRVPGGLINAKHLSLVQELCETYGNGTFHMGTRQTLNAWYIQCLTSTHMEHSIWVLVRH